MTYLFHLDRRKKPRNNPAFRGWGNFRKEMLRNVEGFLGKRRLLP